MDEKKVLVYRHVMKPLNSDIIYSSKLIAPTAKLTLRGSPKNAEIDFYPRGWNAMFKVYGMANTGKEPQFDDIIDGFSCIDARPSSPVRHSFVKIEQEEQKRIVRLMFNRPSRMEKICYSLRSFVSGHDPYKLGSYLTEIDAPFREMEMDPREKRFLSGIGHTEAAKIRLKYMGEPKWD